MTLPNKRQILTLWIVGLVAVWALYEFSKRKPTPPEGAGLSDPLAAEVVTASRVFSQEEIDHIRNSPTLEDHQKAILLVNMLSASGDPIRTEEAIKIAKEQGEHAKVAWAREYSLTAAGFLLEFVGRKEEGVKILERVFSSNRFEELRSADDPLLVEMRAHWPGLAVANQTRICDYLGDYYLKKGDSDRALFFYDAIPPASGRYKKYEYRHRTRVQKADLVAVRTKFAKTQASSTPRFMPRAPIGEWI